MREYWGFALMYVGEYDQALPFLEETTALASQIQAMDQVAKCVGASRPQCLFRMDRWDEVLEIEDKWRDLEEHYSRERIGETCFFVALSGSVYALRGDYERANRLTPKNHTATWYPCRDLPENW